MSQPSARADAVANTEEGNNGETSGILIARREIHSGPLPTPADLQNYDKVLPGLADRIVVMAEKQQDYVMQQKAKIVESEAGALSRGQWMAFILCFVSFALPIFGIFSGNIYAIVVPSIVPVVCIAGLLIARKK
jgi:uncharacterized membrane protein